MGETLAQRAQHTGFADAGLAHEQHACALVGRLARARRRVPPLGGRKPEVGVGDFPSKKRPAIQLHHAVERNQTPLAHGEGLAQLLLGHQVSLA